MHIHGSWRRPKAADLLTNCLLLANKHSKHKSTLRRLATLACHLHITETSNTSAQLEHAVIADQQVHAQQQADYLQKVSANASTQNCNVEIGSFPALHRIACLHCLLQVATLKLAVKLKACSFEAEGAL